MKNAVRDVTLFHTTYGVGIKDQVGFPDKAIREKRNRLFEEELKEFQIADQANDIVEFADGIADMIYILIGTALEHGIDINAIWEEVQRSNMSKLGADGKPIYREDGKVLKGPNYFPPDIHRVLGISK